MALSKHFRFPIGGEYMAKRHLKAKELTAYRVEDHLTTTNAAGEVVEKRYVISHEFCGQRVTERTIDTSIAKAWHAHHGSLPE